MNFSVLLCHIQNEPKEFLHFHQRNYICSLLSVSECHFFFFFFFVLLPFYFILYGCESEFHEIWQNCLEGFDTGTYIRCLVFSGRGAFAREIEKKASIKVAYLLSYFYIHFVAFNSIPSFEFRLGMHMNF